LGKPCACRQPAIRRVTYIGSISESWKEIASIVKLRRLINLTPVLVNTSPWVLIWVSRRVSNSLASHVMLKSVNIGFQNGWDAIIIYQIAGSIPSRTAKC
jgi:hypothetical protein